MLTKPGPKHTLQTAETALDQPEELTKKRIQHRNRVSRLVSRFYSQNIRIIVMTFLAKQLCLHSNRCNTTPSYAGQRESC